MVIYKCVPKNAQRRAQSRVSVSLQPVLSPYGKKEALAHFEATEKTLNPLLLNSTLLYASTLLYLTLLNSTLLYSALLYSMLLYSTLLYSTLLYSTLLYSTLLYATLRYTTRTSQVEEAVEVIEGPKNSTLLIEHILCQV